MRFKLYIRQESTGYVRTRIRELLPSQVDRLKVKLNKREGDFTLICIVDVDQ
jgi:hypothetical protein